MHQAWVLLHLAELYRSLDRRAHPDLQGDARRQSAQYAAHVRDLKIALDTLMGARHALTASGIDFVTSMQRRSSEI